MSSIRISQLNEFTTIQSSDFVPFVDSSSLTTYRVTVDGVNDFWAVSGSARSASYGLSGSYAESSSWADSSTTTVSASHLIYPNVSSASFAISTSFSDSGLSASYAVSSSQARSASIATNGMSSSYAASASVSTNTIYAQTSSTATSSSYAVSASFTNYALTASYYSASLGGSSTPLIDAGTIVAYASSSAPSGWLWCDGSEYDPGTYPNLASLISTLYGKGLVIKETIVPESTSKYSNANNGSVTVLFISGSGYYKISLGVTTTYVTANGTTATFTGLNAQLAGGYTASLSDLGRIPTESYSRQWVIPYGGISTESSSILSTDEYRVPNLESYFSSSRTIYPLIYIIKT